MSKHQLRTAVGNQTLDRGSDFHMGDGSGIMMLQHVVTWDVSKHVIFSQNHRLGDQLLFITFILNFCTTKCLMFC